MSGSAVLAKVLEEVRSGLVSSVIAEAALFPIDSVKLRQQVYGGSARAVFKRIIKEQGARGLYQGLLGRLIQTITSNVGFFAWQTVFVQHALSRVAATGDGRLSTGLSLLVNMLAQQVNRIMTTPVDVVANVNQADPASKGFFHTFVRLAREGGRETLWRGLGVSLLLSLNPAMMFTLIQKLSPLIVSIRGRAGGVPTAGDMFWISGISKAVATLVTYPLIRAKAVLQSSSNAPGGLFATLADIANREGMGGLYSGVWIMSYKTVLFNSLMMALKQKIDTLFKQAALRGKPMDRRKTWNFSLSPQSNHYRKNLLAREGSQKPWQLKVQGSHVVYVDGSWAFLHEAQVHMIREAAARGKHLIVGVHSDVCLHEITGEWPQECYSQRLKRVREHPLVTSVLEDAPWVVDTELVEELGVTKVVSGSFTKTMDTRSKKSPEPTPEKEEPGSGPEAEEVDPYAMCKELGIFEEVQSLNMSTEMDAWTRKVQQVLFSNVDASIDWRILVADGAKGVFGKAPGYGESMVTSAPGASSEGGRLAA
eukprot:TRINITY_DN25775_c0_g1_i1.p1 TRINITY_DN25775_c0_g1~~TRINITY_DN25775_c0_g1_i1.p1  ORF type:complete len:566 (-),score=131.37 TRINITY_DN25775_c0_g1_i1:124-1734(-)